MAKNKFPITDYVFSGKGELSKEETSANILFNAILNNELKDNKDIDQNAVIEHIFGDKKDALVQAFQEAKKRLGRNNTELLNHLDQLIEQFSTPSFPKLEVEKELKLGLSEKGGLNKLNEQEIEKIDFSDKNLNNKVILAYLNDDKKTLFQEQKNAVIERVINDKSINYSVALAVLDKGGNNLTKEDYNKFFDKIVGPESEKLTKENRNKRIIALVETFASPSGNLRNVVKDITGHEMGQVAKPEVKTELNLVDLAQKLNPEQMNLSFPRDKALMGELINDGKINAADIYQQVLKTKKETLVKDFIKMGKDWQPEVNMGMLSNHLLNNWEFNSLEEKREIEWKNGVGHVKELIQDGKYSEKLKKKYGQFEGKYEDFKLPEQEYEKMIIDNIKFSEPSKELEQKIFALKNDELLEKYIKEAKPQVSVEMINHLVGEGPKSSDNPNYKLLEEVFKTDEVVIDEKIMNALSQKRDLYPYLDQYIEKALAPENLKNTGVSKEDVLGAEFNHRAFGKVSVSEYQEHKAKLAQYVKENKFSKLAEFADKGQIGDKKLSYVRDETRSIEGDQFNQDIIPITLNKMS